jgi:hypothetical protein
VPAASPARAWGGVATRPKAGPFRQGRNLRSLHSGRHRVLAAIALAGLKTRHYNSEKQVPRCARDDTAHWRPSAKGNEHNEERSLE